MQNSLLFLTKITRALLIICMGLGIYLIYNTVMVKEPEVNISLKPANVNALIYSNSVNSFNRMDFTDYGDIFKKRDFFENPAEQQQQRRMPSVEAKLQPVEFDLASQYKLVGIILDENPQAIIEDLKSKETLFMFVGDKLGDVVLKKVMPGKVHFTYQGNLLELVQ